MQHSIHLISQGTDAIVARPTFMSVMASSAKVLVDSVNEISADPLPTDEQLVADAWDKSNLLTLGNIVPRSNLY